MIGGLAAHSMMLAVPALFGAQDVDFPRDPGRWYATSPPAVGSEQWYAAQGDAEHEWVVSPGDPGPRVSLRGSQESAPALLPFEIKRGSIGNGLYGRRVAEKVDDGWIVAFNAGVFGAWVWWFSPDGKKRRRISDHHVVGFFPTDAGLLAIEGIAHGSMSQGAISRLSRGADGKWASEPFLNLRHAPEIAVKDADGSLIVATTGRLLRVFPGAKKVDVIVVHAFWEGLYPNSIAVTPSGSIFLGMRHGIARIAEEEGGLSRISWMLPSKEFAERKAPEGFR